MNDTVRMTAGTVFAGDYRIVRPLRSGGQGSLYVVEQLSTSKHRALKLMLPELVAQPTSRKRFELEAKIAARIQSDHIVESIASGVDQKTGIPWLVMELLEGEDLAAMLQRRRHLPPGEVLEIFGQLCHALGEAHKQGVVHRDLKPENIFLAASRRRGMPFMVKVLDFGIARVMAEAQTQSGATVTGLGTPMWMAPEQTVPGGRIEPSTDVWPLGLLAFRMLSGYLFWKAPYDPAASVLMLMAEAFMHPMPAASARAADYKCPERMPPGFDTWFSKCVARDMDDRYANAADAFAALEPILAAVAEDPAASAGSPSRPDPPSAPSARPSTTGPGRATWEGAPELSQSAVLSAEDVIPIVSPAATTPEVEPRRGAPIDDDSGPRDEAGAAIDQPAEALDKAPASPRVATPARSQRTLVVIVASVIGVILAIALFPAVRNRSRAEPVAAPTTTSTITAATASAPTTTAEVAAPPSDADASADSEIADAGDDGSAAASPSASAPAVSGKLKKLCKPAGLKCFANDDCCDRVCRRWVCRANEALRDPYGKD